MQRQDESSNRRQWTRPVLKQLRVEGTDSTGVNPSPRIYEGICLPTSQNTHARSGSYRAPTSGEPLDGSNAECTRQ